MVYKRKFKRRYNKYKKSYKKSNKKLSLYPPPELKYIDSTYTAQSVAINDEQIYVLNLTDQGNDNTKRIGKRIMLNNIVMRGLFEMDVTENAQSIKYYLFIDKQHPTGTSANVNASLYVDSVDTLGRRVINNSARFYTISTGKFTLSSGGNKGKLLEKYIDLRKIPKQLRLTQFTGTGLNLTDLGSYPLYLLITSDAAATKDVTYELKIRLKYTDN